MTRNIATCETRSDFFLRCHENLERCVFLRLELDGKSKISYIKLTQSSVLLTDLINRLKGDQGSHDIKGLE